MIKIYYEITLTILPLPYHMSIWHLIYLISNIYLPWLVLIMLDLIDILNMTIPFDTNPYKCLYSVISLYNLWTCVFWVNFHLRYEVLTSIILSGYDEYWKTIMLMNSRIGFWSYHLSFGLLSSAFYLTKLCFGSEVRIFNFLFQTPSFW